MAMAFGTMGPEAQIGIWITTGFGTMIVEEQIGIWITTGFGTSGVVARTEI